MFTPSFHYSLDYALKVVRRFLFLNAAIFTFSYLIAAVMSPFENRSAPFEPLWGLAVGFFFLFGKVACWGFAFAVGLALFIKTGFGEGPVAFLFVPLLLWLLCAYSAAESAQRLLRSDLRFFSNRRELWLFTILQLLFASLAVLTLYLNPNFGHSNASWGRRLGLVLSYCNATFIILDLFITCSSLAFSRVEFSKRPLSRQRGALLLFFLAINPFLIGRVEWTFSFASNLAALGLSLFCKFYYGERLGSLALFIAGTSCLSCWNAFLITHPEAQASAWMSWTNSTGLFLILLSGHLKTLSTRSHDIH